MSTKEERKKQVKDIHSGATAGALKKKRVRVYSKNFK